MKHLFSPLLPRDPLQGPVLVLAAHPDDEVIGAGGMLAWHGQRGHAVTVVHATDGAKGDPGQREHDIRAVRRAEGKDALARLGLPEARHWDLPDGELPEHLAELTRRIDAVMREIRPRTLYSFHAGEAHRDQDRRQKGSRQGTQQVGSGQTSKQGRGGRPLRYHRGRPGQAGRQGSTGQAGRQGGTGQDRRHRDPHASKESGRSARRRRTQHRHRCRQ